MSRDAETLFLELHTPPAQPVPLGTTVQFTGVAKTLAQRLQHAPTLSCPECNAKLFDQAELDHHIEIIHRKCGWCGFVCASKAAMEAHTASLHPPHVVGQQETCPCNDCVARRKQKEDDLKTYFSPEEAVDVTQNLANQLLPAYIGKGFVQDEKIDFFNKLWKLMQDAGYAPDPSKIRVRIDPQTGGRGRLTYVKVTGVGGKLLRVQTSAQVVQAVKHPLTQRKATW